MAAPARLTVGVVCSVGVGIVHGGRSENEDNYLVARDGRIAVRGSHGERITACAQGPSAVLAVADGMGGHENGHVASLEAVDAIARLYFRDVPQNPEHALRDFVLEAHERLHDKASAHGKVRMGTTLTVVWIIGGRAYWTHVGDSRLYLWRAGQLRRLSHDHTRAEFARRDARPEPAYPHNLQQNFLYGSRGLGNDRGIRIDLGTDTGSALLQTGDRLLLCSDGVSGVVSDVRIEQVLQNSPEPDMCATALVERAIASGSEDNITALVARVDYVASGLDGSTLVPHE